MSVVKDVQFGAVLRAEDYGRAKRFYSEVLGFDVMDAPNQPDTGLVTAESGSRFMIYGRPGMPAPANTVLGFWVPDFDATIAALRAAGVVFEEYDIPEIGLKTVDGVMEAGGTKTAWFKDTEGNIIAVSAMTM